MVIDGGNYLVYASVYVTTFGGSGFIRRVRLDKLRRDSVTQRVLFKAGVGTRISSTMSIIFIFFLSISVFYEVLSAFIKLLPLFQLFYLLGLLLYSLCAKEVRNYNYGKILERPVIESRYSPTLSLWTPASLQLWLCESQTSAQTRTPAKQPQGHRWKDAKNERTQSTLRRTAWCKTKIGVYVISGGPGTLHYGSVYLHGSELSSGVCLF